MRRELHLTTALMALGTLVTGSVFVTIGSSGASTTESPIVVGGIWSASTYAYRQANDSPPTTTAPVHRSSKDNWLWSGRHGLIP